MTLHELHQREQVHLAALGRAAGTIYLAELALRRLVEFVGGDRQVEGVAEGDAISHLASLWKGRGARAVRREVGCLRAAWARAGAARNPWSALMRIGVDPVELRIVTEDEERSLREARDRTLGLWVGVMLETGARPGEICGLRSADVLVDRCAVLIQSRSSARTKNRRSRMCVLSEGVHSRIRFNCLRGGSPWGGGSPRAILSRMRGRLATACRELRIEPGIRPHDFRRTVGTRLALLGVNPAIAAKVLGHSNPATTMRFYTRVQDSDAAAAATSTWVRVIGREGPRTKNLFAALAVGSVRALPKAAVRSA